MTRYQLSSQVLADLIDAHAFDLYDDPMPSLSHAEAYAAKTSAALFDLAAMVLQAQSTTGDLARHAGIAYAYAEQLRLFPRHAARRQLFVPLDILQRHGVNTEDIFAGQTSTELQAALAEMRLHIRSHLAAAHDLLATAPAAGLAAFLPLSLVQPLLQPMERSGYDPLCAE
jgi:Phytoene/squalene synthetase